MKTAFSIVIVSLVAVFVLSDCGLSGRRHKGIVSLSPAVTEILYELGAGDRIIAVSTLCNYPPEAKEKPKAGDFLNPNEEAIVAMRPEIVFDTDSETHRPMWERLEKTGIKVVHFPVDGIDAVVAAYKAVGEAIGEKKKGEELARRFTSEIEALKQKCANPAHRPSAIFFVEFPNLAAVGKNNFVDSLVTAVGGENVVEENGWVTNFPREKVVELAPDFIFVALDGDKMTPQLIEEVEGFFKGTNAQVFVVNGDETARPGPRLPRGWEGIATILHPELFKPEGSE